MNGVATSPFRGRTLAALIAVGVASLVVALLLALYADDFAERPSHEATGYSTSAVGYRALIEVLEEVGIPASTSRTRSAARARNGLLVIVAPDVATEEDRTRLVELVDAANRVLVVLPRWWGTADPDRRRWIEERHEHGAYRAEEVLTALDLDGDVERADAVVAGLALSGAQLIVDGDLEPIEEAEQGGVLVGADGDRYVLADPSFVDNAGIRDRGRLRFTVELIDELRAGGPVVFDETVHGYVDDPSLWKALRRFPLVLVSIHVILALVLLLWAAVGRWGPARAAPPPLAPGKDFLIRHTAALLHAGGHDGHALARYLATTIHGVAQALHAPRDLGGEALRAWLERVRASRGGTIELPALEREVAEAAAAGKSRATTRRIVDLAARIHRWRTEMTHGPRNHP